MKWLIASDLHGSACYTRQLLEACEKENPDRILLLGDLLYHGPRNALPKDYAPAEVIELLNPLADKLTCVRGNCDAEVDQMVLDFPIMADYCVVEDNGLTIYATHGHIFSETQPPKLSAGAILLCGHTHVPKCADHGNFHYLNPGSVSIPKEDSWHGYMTLEQGKFLWKDLSGQVKMEYIHK